MVPGYVIPTPAVALGAATAKTVLMLIASAGKPFTLTELSVSIDVATLCLVELVESTQASNGTAGTDAASLIKQVRGFVAADTTAPGEGARHTFTTEPTVLSLLKSWWFMGPGPFVLQAPLGREVQSLLSGSTKYKAIGLRLTSTLASNSRSHLEYE